MGGSQALGSALGLFLIWFCGFGVSRCRLGLFYAVLGLLGVLCFLRTPFSFPVLSSAIPFGALRFVFWDILLLQFLRLNGRFYMFRFWVFTIGRGGIPRPPSAILFSRRSVCCFGKRNLAIASFCWGDQAPYLKLFLRGYHSCF